MVQPTVGSEVARLESVATNDDPSERIYQGRVATTDATVTTINTIATTNDTTIFVTIYASARRTGGSSGSAGDAAGYVFYTVYKNIGGVLSVLSSSAAFTAESQSGWNLGTATSGTNLLIQVTGAANNNVTWHSTVKVYQVGS